MQRCLHAGNIPPSLYDLGRLRVLRLDNNRLTGALSPALGRLSELRLLDVSNNALCGEMCLFTNFHCNACMINLTAL